MSESSAIASCGIDATAQSALPIVRLPRRDRSSLLYDHLPVDGATAWWVLGILTASLLLAGMWVFSRTEYQDLT